MAKYRLHRGWRGSLSGLMLVGIIGQAQAITYSAGLEDSRWYDTGSIFECSLTHQVPGYGHAVFFQRAGETLSFYLDPVHNNMRPGRAALVIETPEWRGGQAVTDLGYVDVQDREHPVSLSRSHSENMLASLGQGMAPTFTRRARHSDTPVRVRLSNVNFRERYREFRQCTQGLLPVNFDQVERSRVMFEVDKAELKPEFKDRLDKVALYIKADERVQTIYVDGHASGTGRRIHNRMLSRDRAQAVTAYLVRQGVSEDKISTRYHGERYPVARAGATPADNRRATVRLERLDEQGRTQADAGAIIID